MSFGASRPLSYWMIVAVSGSTFGLMSWWGGRAGCWGGSVPVPLTGEGDGAQNKLPGGCQRAPDRTQPAQACQHQQHLNYDTFTIYNSHSLKPEMTRRRALAASDHLTQHEASDLQLSGTLHPALWLRNMDLKQDPGCKNRRF